MRTVRSSSRLLGGSAQGDVYQGGVCQEEVSAQGGVFPRSVCIPACTEEDTPPTEFLTHACENITFPQLRLRTVKNMYIFTNTIVLDSMFSSQIKLFQKLAVV